MIFTTIFTTIWNCGLQIDFQVYRESRLTSAFSKQARVFHFYLCSDFPLRIYSVLSFLSEIWICLRRGSGVLQFCRRLTHRIFSISFSVIRRKVHKRKRTDSYILSIVLYYVHCRLPSNHWTTVICYFVPSSLSNVAIRESKESRKRIPTTFSTLSSTCFTARATKLDTCFSSRKEQYC